MRIGLSALVLFAFSSSAFADKFQLDPSHTGVQFTVSHLVVSKVKGRFDKLEGSFDFDEKTQKLENVAVTIQADSINTNEKDRDKDLRSPNFLDVAKYPQLSFKSTKTLYEKGKPHKVEGNLTIHGVTHPVTLDINYRGSLIDPWGNRRVAFDGETKLSRKDYDLKWNKLLETGGAVVGDEVKIEIEGEAFVPKKK